MPEITRVLHMIGSLEIGGSQAMIMNLYEKIDRKQLQFDFIVDHPEQTYFLKKIETLGGKVYFMPTFKGVNVTEIKHAWNQFFKEHPEYKILHSHVRSYASLYIPIAKKHGVKTIIHSHSTSNGSGITSIVKRIMQYPLRYQADYLMACSNESGRWLYGKKACLKDNYFFLPNAIDTEKYRYSEDVANNYRAELGLAGKFVIGHVGRFHEAKNHMFLLEVFADVAKRRPDAMLLLVGDGDLRSSIEEKIKELQIEDRVILAGSRADVAEIMSAMDVFVFPSLYEGLPVTVVEAQAAGLHCVISNRITEDVDISELVERLPINNTESWTERILSMDVNRIDVMPKIKQAGFDVNDSACRLMDFYETIYRENK